MSQRNEIMGVICRTLCVLLGISAVLLLIIKVAYTQGNLFTFSLPNGDIPIFDFFTWDADVSTKIGKIIIWTILVLGFISIIYIGIAVPQREFYDKGSTCPFCGGYGKLLRDIHEDGKGKITGEARFSDGSRENVEIDWQTDESKRAAPPGSGCGCVVVVAIVVWWTLGDNIWGGVCWTAVLTFVGVAIYYNEHSENDHGKWESTRKCQQCGRRY